MRLSKDYFIEGQILKAGTEVRIEEHLDDIDTSLAVSDLEYIGKGYDRKDNIKFIFQHKRVPTRIYAVTPDKYLYKQNSSGNPAGIIKNITYNDLVHLITDIK